MTRSPASDMWVHSEAVVNGLRVHYVSAGKGPLVLLLHGFPDHWAIWRRQIPALAAAGFRAVAPDLRGYGLTEKPPGIAAYRMDELVKDAAALVRHLGEERAFVVGHDWGGAVAWNLPRRHPELVARLAILNSPHPRAYVRELKTNFEQIGKAWYFAAFQVPLVPELVLSLDVDRFLRSLHHATEAGRRAFTEDDLRANREALQSPGALTAALNYYRAALQAPHEKFPSRIETPTLVLWGEKDPALSTRVTDGLDRWVPNVRVVRLPDAGHWIQAEEAERVNAELIAFFREG